MKTLLVCFALVVTLPCVAQQTTAKKSVPKRAAPAPLCITAPPVSQPQQTLKDDFAKSSLRVLKMIEGETATFKQGRDGGMLVPRETSQAIDALDVDAQSKEEQGVVKSLSTFFSAKIRGNTETSTMYDLAEIALLNAKRPRGRFIAELTARSPTVILIGAKEDSCSTQIDELLRARVFHDVEACTDLALNVDTPKVFDAPIPVTNP